MKDEPPGQSITEALHTTTLLIYIEREREEGDEPLGQLIKEALHTITLHIYIEREEGDEPPGGTKHRGLPYHYTYIYIYI